MAENEKGRRKKNASGPTRRKFIWDAVIVVGSAAIAAGIGHTSINAKEGKKAGAKEP